jgi:hypothetical protein
LSEFDDEKLDIKVFTQELDIRLEDIVGVPCLSIMAEINAIMNGSKRSLRYEPDALQQLQAEKPNPAQDATHELKKPLSINPKTTESSYLPVETNKVQIDLDSAPSKVKVNNKNILDESQPPNGIHLRNLVIHLRIWFCARSNLLPRDYAVMGSAS